MSGHVCSVAGCDREAEFYGMCGKHYTSALVHGAFHTPGGHRHTTAPTPVVRAVPTF